MTLALATRGYICLRGIEPGVLAVLYPESASVRQGAQLEMVVVLTSPAYGDTVIALLSDTPSVLSVPASVTVLDGETSASFFANAGDLGTAQVTATQDTIVLTSSIEVVFVDASLRPRIRSATNIKPRVTSAQNLKPDVIAVDDQEPEAQRPQITEAKSLRPRGSSARNLKPKIYDTEES